MKKPQARVPYSTRLLLAAAASLLAAALPGAAQAPPQIKYRTVTVDCWEVTLPHFCPGNSLQPANWRYSELSVDGPWTTKCEYTDPLPQNTKVVSADAIPWSQYCGSHDLGSSTSYKAMLDGESADIMGTVNDEGEHCQCDGFTGSELFFTGKNYKVGGTNTLEFAGQGGGATTARFYSVDLSLAYTDASSPYYVKVSSSTSGDIPFAAEKSVTPGGTVNVKVVLGSVVSFDYFKKEPGQAGISTIVGLPSLYSVLLSDVEPAPKPPTVYDGQTLLPFGADEATKSRTYMAVHLGTSSVEILPTASDVKAIKVLLTVIAPTRLGIAPNQLDDAIVAVAHDRGIPPQYLKGQVRQEQVPKTIAGEFAFNVLNYRYEPCGTDLDHISRGNTLIDTTPYSTFKLDDAIGVSLVPEAQDDIDPRNALSISVADPKTGAISYRRLTNADRGVTAKQLWDANDKTNSKMNWSDHCGKRKLDKIKSVAGTLDFVAQTPTAASFGLFQTMYDEMVKANLTVVPDASHSDQTSQNPKYLFDRPAYLTIGGGSIQIGTKIDTDNFLTVIGSTSVCNAQDFTYPSTLASQSQYEQYLGYAFQGYNCGFRDKAAILMV